VSSSLIPAEDWPPYRWLWTNIPLSRDDEGNPRPFTHGMRANWQTFAVVVVLILVLAVWWARSLWPVIAAFLVGALAGHVLWAGQPLGVLAWAMA